VKKRGQLDLFTAPAPPPQPARPRTDGLPDQPARDRIVNDLDTNLLVEAGAGSGKTTVMVERMVALIRNADARVERIVAVTFTRKAAAELRERFQTRLEKELRTVRAEEDDARVETLDRALRTIDRAFIGTIHAFCARLLRERPLDAGLDPGFREILPAEEMRLRAEFWRAHVERLVMANDPSLDDLARIGVATAQVRPLFERMIEHPDVVFPAPPAEMPGLDAARAGIVGILEQAETIMPREEPDDGWDRLMRVIRRLRFRQYLGWQRDVAFLDAVSELCRSNVTCTKSRWSHDPHIRAAAKSLEERVATFKNGDGNRLVQAWYAHRYPIIVAFATEAAARFAEYRRRMGTLTFNDLLVLAARLLRTSAAARAELGHRYRWILVDEFQDTDPLQAEVLLLLASDPAEPETTAVEPETTAVEPETTAAEPETTAVEPETPNHSPQTIPAFAGDWRTVTPRPGALFVVGDPKQSIYRFRRADIALYAQVKERFEQFGAVVELTSNFRSLAAIGDFANAVFPSRFPAPATRYQASYAPLLTQRDEGPGMVAWLGFQPRGTFLKTAEDEAHRIAGWVADRVARGERQPGDFLLLTRQKKYLPFHARALEARGVPVQVTGAGLGIERELEELELLLRALSDPGDATLTLAVLVGLFFGIDYETLVQHVVDRGRRLSFTYVPDAPETEVEHALATLHELWRTTRTDPADIAVAKIVERLGLLPFAAAGELGESRAGALLYILDAVRKASTEGDASIAGAIAAIEAALAAEEAEAPLVPGRSDAVRVMNLHQAKGLQAKVVILAAPVGRPSIPPDYHVERGPAGARGHALVYDGERWMPRPIAHPADWVALKEEESRFEAAEQDRLLYVAVTRAEDELVVSRAFDEENKSPWNELYPELEARWPRIDFIPDAHDTRPVLECSADELLARVRAADDARREHARPTFQSGSVRARVKGKDLALDQALYAGGRGPDWGSAVHGALEEAARGARGVALRSVCRSLLLTNERPAGEDGEPVELDELVLLVDTVLASPLWQRAGQARDLLVEAPFSLAVPAAEYATMLHTIQGNGGNGLAAGPGLEIVDGVIDLVFRDEDGWVVVDYKSDVAGSAIDPRLMERYRAQVGLYGAAWERLTGEPVAERAILFTATGELLTW
jgi:ATP-dependent helicase/nuclease subunit A